MNIQLINFTAKHRFKQSKPTYTHDLKTSHETLDAAVKRYEEQQQFEKAKNVVPTIKKASQSIIDRVPAIIKRAKLIQDKADDLFEKIEATSAYNTYFNDSNSRFGKTLSLYPDELKFDDKLFDIIIYPNKKITAIERTNGIASRVDSKVGLNKGEIIEYSAKDIYEFDIQTGELTYFARGHKKEGYVTSIEKEYKFNNGRLDEYNESVAKGQFNLISRAFKFDKDEKLSSFGAMKRQTWNKDCFERLFVFDKNGMLKTFARGLEIVADSRATGECIYKFNSKGNFINFANDFKGDLFTYQGETDICF